MITKSLEKLAKFEERKPFVMISLFVIVTIIFLSGFSLIKTDTSFESFVPETTEVIRSINEIGDKLGTGTTNIIMIVSTEPSDPLAVNDIRSLDIIKPLDTIVKQIEENEFIVGTQSITSVLKKDNLQTQSEINSLLETNTLISKDYSITIVRFIIPDGLSTEKQADIVSEIRHIISNSEKPYGIKIVLAGEIIQSQEIGEAIGGRMGLVTGLGFVGVFVVLYFIFRKPSFVFVSILPIIFSTVWTFGTLAYAGIAFSTPLIGIFSMIIGVGIDFAIHIVHRFEEEISSLPLEEAVVKAVSAVGRGLTLTTLTTVIGFLALLSATLPLLQDMAIALSFGVIYSLLSAIGIIPPIMILFERRKNKKAKKNSRTSQKKQSD